MQRKEVRVYARGLVRYDPLRRRMWIVNQRLHHGLTGAMLAAAGMALMAHDWRDRSRWLTARPSGLRSAELGARAEGAGRAWQAGE